MKLYSSFGTRLSPVIHQRLQLTISGLLNRTPFLETRHIVDTVPGPQVCWHLWPGN